MDQTLSRKGEPATGERLPSGAAAYATISLVLLFAGVLATYTNATGELLVVGWACSTGDISWASAVVVLSAALRHRASLMLRITSILLRHEPATNADFANL